MLLSMKFVLLVTILDTYLIVILYIQSWNIWMWLVFKQMIQIVLNGHSQTPYMYENKIIWEEPFPAITKVVSI